MTSLNSSNLMQQITEHPMTKASALALVIYLLLVVVQQTNQLGLSCNLTRAANMAVDKVPAYDQELILRQKRINQRTSQPLDPRYSLCLTSDTHRMTGSILYHKEHLILDEVQQIQLDLTRRMEKGLSLAIAELELVRQTLHTQVVLPGIRIHLDKYQIPSRAILLRLTLLETILLRERKKIRTSVRKCGSTVWTPCSAYAGPQAAGLEGQ